MFEGLRVYNTKAFKLREHSERLVKSAELLGFEIPYTVDQIDEATKEIIKAQDITDGYVRPISWRGSEKMAISAQHNKIHLAIAAWPWPPYFAKELHEKGISLRLATYQRPSPKTAPTASKAAGLYMICTISKHEAERDGYHDALMLDYRGYLAEATGANLFLVIDGEIHTPTADCFLDGITRRTVIDLAGKRGIKVHERHIMPQELSKAQEVFLTGTAAEITPVGQIDGFEKPFIFKPAAVTHQLVEDYHQLVRS